MESGKGQGAASGNGEPASPRIIPAGLPRAEPSGRAPSLLLSDASFAVKKETVLFKTGRIQTDEYPGSTVFFGKTQWE